MSKGHRAEELLRSILAVPLLEEFVHRSPHKMEAGGIRKEHCDILVEDGIDAVVVQLKVPDAEDAGARWVNKNAKKGARQATGAMNALDRFEIRIQNLLRGELVVPPRSFSRVQALVVLDYRGPPIELEAVLPRRVARDRVIQYLSASDFKFICDHLRTLPDLLTYLHARAGMPEWSVPLFGDERNAYAYYIQHGRLFPPTIGREDLRNEWQRLTQTNSHLFQEKLDADAKEDSYRFVLSCLHPDEAPFDVVLAPDIELLRVSDRRLSSFELRRRLNLLNTIERRNFVDLLRMVMERAETRPHGYGYSAMILPRLRMTLVGYASKEDRSERTRALVQTTTAALNAVADVDYAVGIVTEPTTAHSLGRSFDSVIVGPEYKLAPDSEAAREAATFFKFPRHVVDSDFPSMAPGRLLQSR